LTCRIDSYLLLDMSKKKGEEASGIGYDGFVRSRKKKTDGRRRVMRKNIEAVIAAFNAGKSHQEKTCRTDGRVIYSYALVIAERLPNGSVKILDEGASPSRTTTAQIRAVRMGAAPKGAQS